MTIDPPLPTMGLVLFVSLIAMLVLGFVFAAAAKRGAAAVVALVLCTAFGAMLLTGLTRKQDVRAEAEAKAAFMREQALQIAMQAARPVPTPPTAPASWLEKRIDEHHGSPTTLSSAAVEAEVASDEELAAVASAQPKIELDSEIVIGDKAEDVKGDRPDWIDAHLGDNQKLIVAGPYAYAQACQIETDQELQKWLAEKFTGGEVTSETMKAVSSLALKNYKKEQHQEVRETSVGEFYILYTLAEVSPKSAKEIAEFAKLMAVQAAKTARMKGAQFVTFAGAGVLSLVALTHVVLRSGGRRAKSTAA
jgi:hypothetical protein